MRRMTKTILGQRSLLPPNKRVVFVYHDISAPDAAQYSPHYSTPPETFVRHLDIFQTYLHFVTLDEIVSAETPERNRPLASITFDDGFRSTREHAHPLLSERNIPFTLFVNGRAIRENRLDNLALFEPPSYPTDLRIYLDAAEIAEMARSGVQIGSHTTGHAPLAGRSDGELDEQIVANKAYLESLVQAPVRHLALPYGKKEHYDRRALDRCFSSGHTYVYSTNPALFSAENVGRYRNDPVPRIGFTNETKQELLFVLNRPLFRTIDL